MKDGEAAAGLVAEDPGEEVGGEDDLSRRTHHRHYLPSGDIRQLEAGDLNAVQTNHLKTKKKEV